MNSIIKNVAQAVSSGEIHEQTGLKLLSAWEKRGKHTKCERNLLNKYSDLFVHKKTTLLDKAKNLFKKK